MACEEYDKKFSHNFVKMTQKGMDKESYRLLGVRYDELLSFQKDMLREKELLTGLLAKVEGQINALQVEQLHLINSMNSASKSDLAVKSEPKLIKIKNATNESIDECLDLSIPTFTYFGESEDDYEEDCKDDIFDNLCFE